MPFAKSITNSFTINYLKWRNFGADLICRNQKLFKFGTDLIWHRSNLAQRRSFSKPPISAALLENQEIILIFRLKINKEKTLQYNV